MDRMGAHRPIDNVAGRGLQSDASLELDADYIDERRRGDKGSGGGGSALGTVGLAASELFGIEVPRSTRVGRWLSMVGAIQLHMSEPGLPVRTLG